MTELTETLQEMPLLGIFGLLLLSGATILFSFIALIIEIIIPAGILPAVSILLWIGIPLLALALFMLKRKERLENIIDGVLILASAFVILYFLVPPFNITIGLVGASSKIAIFPSSIPLVLAFSMSLAARSDVLFEALRH